jgi:hypothetical protein
MPVAADSVTDTRSNLIWTILIPNLETQSLYNNWVKIQGIPANTVFLSWLVPCIS